MRRQGRQFDVKRPRLVLQGATGATDLPLLRESSLQIVSENESFNEKKMQS
jgi:hypothetical protein